MLGFLPVVSANSSQSPFPDIPFHVFNGFVQNHFSSQISLTTVLTILFSLTNNPDLLNLHARQQHPKAEGEIAQTTSGWIKALAHALENRLANATDTMFHGEEHKSELTNDQVVTRIGMKLDGLAKVLKLDPYDKWDQFCEKLKPVSEQNIEPVYVICPGSSECETMECQSHFTQEHDTSKATLIKGTKIHDNVPVLAGQCPVCLTTYHADHERFKSADGTWTKLYLNSARHLKVGQKIWVDRTFSTAVLNGTYHFHASSSAFAEFWNSSFWSTQNTISRARYTHPRILWESTGFLQDSHRTLIGPPQDSHRTLIGLEGSFSTFSGLPQDSHRTPIGLSQEFRGILWTVQRLSQDSCGIPWTLIGLSQDSCGIPWTLIGLSQDSCEIPWTLIGLLWNSVDCP
jgi:hypothetical protein